MIDNIFPIENGRLINRKVAVKKPVIKRKVKSIAGIREQVFGD